MKKKKISLAILTVIVLRKVLIKDMYLSQSSREGLAKLFYEPETLHVLTSHPV